MRPYTLRIRFDDLGRVEPCGDISPVALMTSLCPNCNHALSDHQHPDKRCNQCDTIASWFITDRMSQRSNTIEIQITPGQYSDGYMLVSQGCSIGCSEHHSYEPGCALYGPIRSKVGLEYPKTEQNYSPNVPPWEGDMPTAKMLFEAAAILETAPYGRHHIAAWLREQARAVDGLTNQESVNEGSLPPPPDTVHPAVTEYLDSIGRPMTRSLDEEIDRRGLETPENARDSGRDSSLDDRVSELWEIVDAMARGGMTTAGYKNLLNRVHQLELDNKQLATEKEHVARELWRLRDHTVAVWRTRQHNLADCVERLQAARDKMIGRQNQLEANQRVAQEDSDQNIIKVREEMRELETQIRSWSSEFTREHVTAKLKEAQEWFIEHGDLVRAIGRMMPKTTHTADPVYQLHERLTRVERALGDVVRNDWAENQMRKSSALAARLDAVERMLNQEPPF